jgi:hypothetical protein
MEKPTLVLRLVCTPEWDDDSMTHRGLSDFWNAYDPRILYIVNCILL